MHYILRKEKKDSTILQCRQTRTILSDKLNGEDAYQTFIMPDCRHLYQPLDVKYELTYILNV